MANFRHVVKGVYPGEAWSCTLHTTGSLTVAAANTAWQNAWTALWNGVTAPTDNINQLIETTVTSNQMITAQLDPVTGKQTAIAESTVTLAGTATTANLPPQNSVVISWQTATPTKAGRGRMYLPTFVAAALSSGLLGPASQTIVKFAGGNLLASLQGAGLVPVIYSRANKTTIPITGGTVGNVVDTQRRRRDKLIETRVALATG